MQNHWRCWHQRNVWGVLLNALLLVSQPLAQERQSSLDEQIETIVQADMAARQIVGTSVGVTKNGELLLAKGYGYADLENEVKANEHTVFRIGSVTKQFTVAAIMLLVEQGKLSLEDDLRKFLPDYPTGGRRVTIDRLLTHTSGIKGYTEMAKFLEVSRLNLTHEQMIGLFSGEPFEFDPGERFQYNNSAYYLLGVIIEKVSGQAYEDFLRENVLKRLDLGETFYLDDSPILKRRARGYEVRNSQVVNADYISMRPPFSAGALGSTANDLLKWQTSLVHGKLVTQASYRRMTTPAVLNDGTRTTRGYGLILGSMANHQKVSHGGAINGFRSQLAYYPEDDLSVVVLCNSGAARPEVLESQIARLVLKIPEISVTEVPMAEVELSKYVGTYDPGRSPLRVAVANGALALSGRRLRSVGNHGFVAADDPYQQVTFRLERGEIVSLVMEREGQQTVARRIKP